MATIYGNNGEVQVSSTVVGEVKSWSLSMTRDTIEDTAMGDDNKTFTYGKMSATGTIEVHFDDDDSAQGSLRDAVMNGTTVTLNLYTADSSTSGTDYYTGTALLTSADVSVEMDSIESRTFNFTITGDVTKNAVA
jgi:hypothetical protein